MNEHVVVTDHTFKEYPDYLPLGKNRKDDTNDGRLILLFQKYVSGEESMASVDSEESGEDDAESVGDEALNTTICQIRRKRNSRRRSVAGASFHSLGSGGVDRRRSAIEVVELLRHYYQQEQSMRLEPSIEQITIPLNFDLLTLDQMVDSFLDLKDQVDSMYESYPKLISENHKMDLQQLITLIRNQYNRTKRILVTSAFDPSLSEPHTSQKQQQGSTDSYDLWGLLDSIKSRTKSIECLQSEIRERMQELRVLKSLKGAVDE